MTRTIFEEVEGLQIGTVEFVSPRAIIVKLNMDAPASVALNSGDPRLFPRVSSYLLIPVDTGMLVGQVEWLTLSRAASFKQIDKDDFDLVDLPLSDRKLRINPLGKLFESMDNDSIRYTFSRGNDILPPLGASVLLPTLEQLKAVIAPRGSKNIMIGTTPGIGNAEVYVNPDRLFGRHLAILGNTGSGKSCSVAGLIRWSLEQAQSKNKKNQSSSTNDLHNPNARFVILDPNGEYEKAFGKSELGIQARVFKVDPRGSASSLKVPLWFWNTEEWSTFTQATTRTQIPLLRRVMRAIKGNDVADDTPIQFDVEKFTSELEELAENQSKEYVSAFKDRVKVFLNHHRMKDIIDGNNVKLEEWLENYIGADSASNGCVSVIDLSFIPTEIIHVVTAVIARIIFEVQQRYVKINSTNEDANTLPTVLVLDEAHIFLKAYKFDADNMDASSICCRTFERIAREGRKFGLGLVVSSQRPSELSPTVLSQCNTFLLHRITNDIDQDLVKKLVPDTLRGLLHELPLLSSQNAILLGWASELPLLIKMTTLPESQRPRSDDPNFWDVWIGVEDRPINWGDIVADWQEGFIHE